LIADFDSTGNLPSGIHDATWGEVNERFGTNLYRRRLLVRMKSALENLSQAGCTTIFVDGSFATSKPYPNDYDCCWEVDEANLQLVDPILKDLTPKGRAAQKVKYGGEFFPSVGVEGSSRSPFLEFFQRDKETGLRKGIVRLRLVKLD
jgi:hypothetical protein